MPGLPPLRDRVLDCPTTIVHGWKDDVVPVEQSIEFRRIFAGQDEGLGVEAVLEAVETDGGAAFGRGRARAFLRVQTVSFDLSFR